MLDIVSWIQDIEYDMTVVSISMIIIKDTVIAVVIEFNLIKKFASILRFECTELLEEAGRCQKILASQRWRGGEEAREEKGGSNQQTAAACWFGEKEG